MTANQVWVVHRNTAEPFYFCYLTPCSSVQTLKDFGHLTYGRFLEPSRHLTPCTSDEPITRRLPACRTARHTKRDMHPFHERNSKWQQHQWQTAQGPLYKTRCRCDRPWICYLQSVLAYCWQSAPAASARGFLCNIISVLFICGSFMTVNSIRAKPLRLANSVLNSCNSIDLTLLLLWDPPE